MAPVALRILLLLGAAIAFMATGAVRASEIRISSFNVNFNNDRLKETFALVARFNPGIILLQESTAQFEKGAREFLPGGYKHRWFVEDKQHPAGGFAVLSKLPIVDRKFIE